MGTQVLEHSGEGAPKGNQNRRTHGWTSKLHPAPLPDIIDAANSAAEAQDLPTLRKAARALDWRGHHDEAASVRQLLEIATYEKGRTMENALRSPRSVEIPAPAPIRVAPTQPRATATRARIATGSRPTDQGPFPTI
jgi:hypothetical protein